MTTTTQTPVVGDPATYSVGSDSYPATVVAVSKSGHRVTLQDDDWKVVSGSMVDGSAKYTYSPYPQGPTRVATRRADGSYRLVGWSSGGWVGFGRRVKHYDPSF